MSLPSTLSNQDLPKQESLVNLIEAVNNNQLGIYYSKDNSVFKQKIDNLNLLFYIETEKILKRQKTYNTDYQSQDTLLILLFTQINLYIEEIERLNKVIKDNEDNIIKLRRNSKEEKALKRLEIRTKDQIINKLRGSIALLEGSLLEQLRKRVHSEGNDLCDYSLYSSSVSQSNHYSVIKHYTILSIEAYSFNLLPDKRYKNDSNNTMTIMKIGRNNNSDSIILNGSCLVMNNNNNNKVTHVINYNSTPNTTTNKKISLGQSLFFNNNRQYSIDDNKAIETSFGHNNSHFYRKTNENPKKKSGMKIIKNVKEKVHKLRIESGELPSSDRDRDNVNINITESNDYVDNYACSFPFQSAFKTQRILPQKRIITENKRYIDLKL